MKRINWLPAPAAFVLSQCCRTISAALEGEGYGCYLVGSCLTRRDYRDVDVRFIMKDEAFERMFPGAQKTRPDLHPLWSLMCTSFSLFLQTHTGLPVDFQIQAMSAANEEFDGSKHERHPLGMFTHPTPRDYAAATAHEEPAK